MAWRSNYNYKRESNRKIACFFPSSMLPWQPEYRDVIPTLLLIRDLPVEKSVIYLKFFTDSTLVGDWKWEDKPWREPGGWNREEKVKWATNQLNLPSVSGNCLVASSGVLPLPHLKALDNAPNSNCQTRFRAVVGSCSRLN